MASVKKSDRTTKLKAEPAIEVKNVGKHFKLPHEKKSSLKQHFVGLFSKKPGYEKFEALKDINFTVNKGDFFGIVGRNGSGKSTLLKIISGIYQPSSGEVKLNGTLTPFIELGIGFNPELTGRENVYLNGSILGLTKKQIDNLYDEIVDFAELHKFMDQKLKNYSSGMSVRLAFSIAIRAQNDLLLLDEVLAVGDINFQKKCFDYFQKLKSEKKTVIFVTHDMGAVKEYCNKAVLINDSRVIPTKDVNDVLEKYMEIMNGGDTNSKNKDAKNKVITDSSKADSRIKIGEPSISIKSDGSMTLNYSVSIAENLRSTNLYTAFSVKDFLGRRLFGTSSQVQGYSFTGTSIANISWGMAKSLSKGKYKVNISVFNEDSSIKHTFEDVVKFTIDGPENYFAVNPVTELKITN